ncbi:MAG: YbaK/EbsC family protein [Actinomycetota bacterium]|nr:YbaK/EbsC family protein [Actinomycetota bacterium]
MSSVIGYLQERGVPFLVLPDPKAETAVETARGHGFPADEVVKTLVVTTRYGHALLVVGADREVVHELIVAALGDQEVRVMEERDLLRNYPDYEPGSIPPLGLFFSAPMYVDADVARHDAVVFAVGRPALAIRMLTKDLFRDDPAVIVPLTRESAEDERLRDGAVSVDEPDLSITLTVAEDEPAE